MSKFVRDAMTPDPTTIDIDMTVLEAARMMDREDVGSIPVVDADKILVGMITDRDITLRVVAAGRDPGSTKVLEVATRPVSPAYPDEPLDEAMDAMAYRQVRRMPVIEDDRVVGILAQADIAHEIKDKKAGHLLDAISQEREPTTGPFTVA